MEDINSGFGLFVRKAIESEVAASCCKYSEEDTTLDAAGLSKWLGKMIFQRGIGY
jgi:hypothetical protein